MHHHPQHTQKDANQNMDQKWKFRWFQIFYFYFSVFFEFSIVKQIGCLFFCVFLVLFYFFDSGRDLISYLYFENRKRKRALESGSDRFKP